MRRDSRDAWQKRKVVKPRIMQKMRRRPRVAVGMSADGRELRIFIPIRIVTEFTPEDGLDISELTVREKEVLALILKGKVHKEIAEALHMQVCTSRYHTSNILRKLGLQSKASLIKFREGIPL